MVAKMQLRPFSETEIGTIYEKCLEFLSTKGVKVEHQTVPGILAKAGAQVDTVDQVVRFPKDIIETALKTVPREILLAGGDSERDARIMSPRDRFFIATATGNVNYLDPDSNTYRDVDMAYVTEWARLCEVLDQIDMVFFPFPQDVPLQTADVHALKSTLENTSKHVIVQPYSLESLESLFELAVVAAGGEKALRKRPLISMVSTSLPPFQFKPMDVEAIVLATRYGVPIYAASLPSIGATSPATIFGTVLQNGIEVLASLVMSQLIFPGTPFIGNPVAFTMDMSSGRNVIASIEAELCQAACTQFVKEAYRIPTAPFGFATDSVVPDGQSMLNRSLLGFLVATAGADILAEAGHLEAGLVSSPVQLVLDDMLSSMLRRAAAETKVDDDALAVKEVFETLPGGHYLDRAHTLRHCRDALRSGLLVNQTRMDWVDAGSKDLSDRAADRYRELKYDMHPSEMPPEVRKELAIIAKNADSRLAR